MELQKNVSINAKIMMVYGLLQVIIQIHQVPFWPYNMHEKKISHSWVHELVSNMLC